jgi:pimeloyl-ACP methyl ester carboxylesterase
MLYTEESGTPGAPTILFLHGAGMTHWMWKAQVAALQDYYCLVVDLPGHGKSNHIAWESLAHTTDELTEVIQTKATDGKASVVGLSLGGYATLDLLTHHPALINRAVISGVTAEAMTLGKAMSLQMRLMSHLLQFPPVIWMQARMLNIPPEDYPEYAAGMRSMSRQTFLRILDEILYFHAPQALRHVHVPTLVTAGGAEMPQILNGIKTLVDLMPEAQGAVMPGVHHGWNGEAPHIFNAMLRAWFENQLLPQELEIHRSPVTV